MEQTVSANEHAFHVCLYPLELSQTAELGARVSKVLGLKELYALNYLTSWKGSTRVNISL
jgi:hypothetical protein